MVKFREFFKTKIGMQKKADDPSFGAAGSMRAAFGAPAPSAPAAPEAPTPSLGSKITSGLNSMLGR